MVHVTYRLMEKKQGSRPITFYIIGLTFIIFLFQLASDRVTDFLAFTPSSFLSGAFWQPITYLLTHGSFLHIFFNMFVLLIFGVTVEKMLGRNKFIALYIISGIGSALIYLLFTGFADNTLVGASGAVYGVVTAYAWKRPKDIIWIFPGIPLPAAVALGAIIVGEILFGITGAQPGIANFGHLGGILTAAIILLIFKLASRIGQPKRSNTFKDIEFAWE